MNQTYLDTARLLTQVWVGVAML